ncbi:head GIN domain-containing protein [Aquimarina pacifica]|uniref:head GIN domain-containing protein n=1 Tax=Aquimarina pacifica TaxID=1296415 RepID=UPI000471A34E|nr:head GIN domain-containing protein [Aquimarina pacifica]
MKKLGIILVIICCNTISLHAQWWGNGKKINGDGNVVTKNRTIPEYDQIKVKGSLDVVLVSGTEGKITIEGESNLIDYIKTEVQNDVLKIYVQKGYYIKPSYNKKLLITAPFKDITQVTLSGSGDINGSDVIKASNFKTSVSGSGDIKLTVEADKVWGQVSGSGDLILIGSAENLSTNVAGSGDISAYDLKAQNVTANISGSGDIEVSTSSSLKARIAGSGNIFYKGEPEIEDKKVSGSGDIRKL